MDTASIPTEYADLLGRLLLAVLSGAAIGIDRELQHKPAGLRTHAIVALGSCVTTIVSLLLAASPTLDRAAPGRTVQGIIAGVGFIGGGAIFHNRTSGAFGLTTAATIWMVAATGIAAGAGLWRAALTVTAIVLMLLVLGDPIERMMKRHGHEQPPEPRAAGDDRDAPGDGH